MSLKKVPFRRYELDTKTNTFTIKLNAEERIELDKWKYLLQQSKDSTAIKQLAKIGAKVLQDEKIAQINSIILNNYRKNKRLGIIDFD